MKEKNPLISNKKEINQQKGDFNKIYRSNSQYHYKDITSNNYDHRIRLNPKGEYRNHYIRYHIPTNHVKHYLQKSDHLSKSMTSFENAEYESKIASELKKHNYQTLLENDKHIRKLCHDKNKEINDEIKRKKEKLRQELTRIINNAILFSKKNNPVKSMLPENINEIVDQAKKETQDLSLSFNISNLSKISSIRGDPKKPMNIEFLALLGVDVENMSYNHININIEKAWNFIKKLAKGRKVDEILRYKVVNCIMNITEKKASEKARKIYEKLDIYNRYMSKKREEERKKKEKEDYEKYQELLKTNPKELIKLKMAKSVSQGNIFKKQEKISRKPYMNKKFTRSKSVVLSPGNKKVTRLNSYKDVDKIINFIETSKKGSQSKLCKEHFTNIQMTKSMDVNMKKMLRRNEIILK